MSEAYTLTIEGEGEAREKLAKLYSGNTLPAGLHSAIAQAAADVVRGHLKARDNTHSNRLGGRRSHFYWNAAETVRGEATASGAEVVINYTGLRQRWLGGDIYPVNAKKLAIPARSESYGVPPKEFPGDLIVVKFRSGAMALVKDEQTHTTDQLSGGYKMLSAEKGQRRTRKRTVGLVEYWLVDHVHQSPDPTVLPSVKSILDAATEAAGEYLVANE